MFIGAETRLLSKVLPKTKLVMNRIGGGELRDQAVRVKYMASEASVTCGTSMRDSETSTKRNDAT